MKIHYINILLFELPLNILIYNQRNHYITRTPKTNTRTLCECELYSPANYDDDPQMKEVMDNFNRQTQQRFHEYDERMVEKRMQCKDKCDKEIQKIILKDKLEKQMKQELTTLETKITTEDIPTCICEKSLADKVEKGCLRCAGVLGGGVMPGMGLIDGSLLGAISVLQPLEIAAAKAAAIAEGAAKGAIAGNAQGMEVVINFLKYWGVDEFFSEIFESILKISHYSKVKDFADAIITKKAQICADGLLKNPAMCLKIDIKFGLSDEYGTPIAGPANIEIPQKISGLVEQADQAAAEAAKNTSQSVAAKITEEQTAVINATYTSWQIAITASVIAIVVIVLIMKYY
ncbi:rifin [Plasmodium falciparum IGH-CR14]|uniref:Rifin n=1 Tax=Plasmodium falciparum IGH-CR14 TaxID=580059 RepID=A0A0L1IAM5_PLAFA|nr:rifin [Plasmodium falciparum IGH-CR14]